MQTHSGRQYWPLDPKPDDVDIFDIAHALSNLCRFGGHVSSFYSVAQHSVYVSHNVPLEWRLVALLHDATEAYVVDVPRPLKKFLTNYKEIELLNWFAIAERFYLPLEMPECIHDADNFVLRAEARILMPRSEWAYADHAADLGRTFQPLEPRAAKMFFLDRFMELTDAGH